MLSILTWDFLKPGDTVDVVAPSSPPSNPKDVITRIKKYFEKEQINVNIPDNLIQPTPILNEANTVEARVDFIVKALLNPKSKAIWAILGGGWGVEMLSLLKERLEKLKLPYVKPVLGYSDVTAMHIFFNQYLNFTSLHCIELGANGDIEPAWNQSKIQPVIDVLMGKTPSIAYEVSILNPKTLPSFGSIPTKIVGGNSLLLNALKGSKNFTLDTKGKTLFVESVALGAGEVSRIINGFRYSNVVQQADAVLFGNFLEKGGHVNSPLVEKQFDLVRQFFAKSVNIPVFHTPIFGHGPVNNPLPLNTCATFTFSSRDDLILNSDSKVVLEVSANKVIFS